MEKLRSKLLVVNALLLTALVSGACVPESSSTAKTPQLQGTTGPALTVDLACPEVLTAGNVTECAKKSNQLFAKLDELQAVINHVSDPAIQAELRMPIESARVLSKYGWLDIYQYKQDLSRDDFTYDCSPNAFQAIAVLPVVVLGDKEVAPDRAMASRWFEFKMISDAAKKYTNDPASCQTPEADPNREAERQNAKYLAYYLQFEARKFGYPETADHREVDLNGIDLPGVVHEVLAPQGYKPDSKIAKFLLNPDWQTRFQNIKAMWKWEKEYYETIEKASDPTAHDNRVAMLRKIDISRSADTRIEIEWEMELAKLNDAERFVLREIWAKGFVDFTKYKSFNDSKEVKTFYPSDP